MCFTGIAFTGLQGSRNKSGGGQGVPNPPWLTRGNRELCAAPAELSAQSLQLQSMNCWQLQVSYQCPKEPPSASLPLELPSLGAELLLCQHSPQSFAFLSAEELNSPCKTSWLLQMCPAGVRGTLGQRSLICWHGLALLSPGQLARSSGVCWNGWDRLGWGDGDEDDEGVEGGCWGVLGGCGMLRGLGWVLRGGGVGMLRGLG